MIRMYVMERSKVLELRNVPHHEQALEDKLLEVFEPGRPGLRDGVVKPSWLKIKSDEICMIMVTWEGLDQRPLPGPGGAMLQRLKILMQWLPQFRYFVRPCLYPPTPSALIPDPCRATCAPHQGMLRTFDLCSGFHSSACPSSAPLPPTSH